MSPRMPAVNDRGASMILVALALVVLMGFAAVAVDSGLVFDDRRQEQSAADGGALAAAQFAKKAYLPGDDACDLEPTTKLRLACRGAEEAIDVVDGTLPGRYDAAAWLACTDPAAFAIVSKQSPCISFSNNFQKTRVHLPTTDVETAFGGLLGRATIPVSGFAEVALDLDQSADVLPFAVGPSGAAGNSACFFAQTPSSLNAYPCTGPTQGNFGKLDLALYGNPTLGTNKVCGNAQTQVKLAVNLVVGADHFLEINTKTAGTIDDFANCDLITNSVDHVYTQTGNSAGGLENGLINGISTPALEGRIMCKGSMSSSTIGESQAAAKKSDACVGVRTNKYPEAVDHTPLWNFITGYAAAAHMQCATPSPPGWNRILMEACIAAWKLGVHPADKSLFSNAMRYSPRFGAVPILNTDPGGGSGNYDIIDIRPVYIETLYIKCSGPTNCDIVHSPGEPSIGGCPPMSPAVASCGWPDNSNSNKNIEALSAFMLTLDMLDPKVRDKFPTVEGTAVYNLSR